MSLPDGIRLGSYEILSALGAGGMGEVYRARDKQLDRDVAIKLLPAAFANDAERLARFQREAKVLASLNHPHIAAIYGLEDAHGVKAIVMELVEGEDLGQRLTRGAIPLDEALPIARQIAEALEAAHEQAVIHRDLKPANIRVRPDGSVKVLDFGLAKALEPAAGTGTDVTPSPTITSPAITQMGIILGTAAYMSPEQVKGRRADKRSDVWAFGAVLYEMLSGRRAFKGDDVSDTLASVLRQDVDWTALPAPTPAPLRRLIARCLDRDVKRRLRDIGEARIVLEDPAAAAMEDDGSVIALAPPRPLWRRGLPFAITTLVASALGGAAVWTLRPSAAPAVVRFAFALPEDQNFTSPGRRQIAISPDGTKIVYVANFQLYLRSIGDLEARPIQGSDIADHSGKISGVTNPAFSPDGQFIAFFSGADNTLKKIPVSGGAASTLCSAINAYGLSWGDTGIVFGQGAGGIMRVSPNGGTPEKLISVQDDEVAHGPEILPDGHSVLMTLTRGTGPDRWNKGRIVVQSLTSGERKTLVDGGSDARYSRTGHLVYALGGIAFAVPFDLRRLQTTGAPVPVVEGVRRSGTATGAAQLSFSSSGSLMYIPGPVSASDQQDLAWVDRTGVAERLKIPAGAYEHVRVSPEGKRLTFGTDDGKEANVHVYAPGSGTSIRRLTFGGNNRFPIWAADGKRIAFQSDRDGDRGIFWLSVDGGKAERLTKADEGTSHVPEAWAPDGDRFLYTVTKGSSVTLWTVSLKEQTNTRVDAVESYAPIGAVFSPDGRWIAYATNNTVYVQPFPPTGSQYQVSRTNAGHHPIWSSVGKELFYEQAQFQFVGVAVRTQPSFTFGNPVSWPGPYGSRNHLSIRNRDLAPDGKRFICPVPAESESLEEIRVVLNWHEELKRLVPSK